MLLQGTLGHDFDIFPTSGESNAWVLLWKTRSRPIGVRVCPVAQFDFCSTAFDLREWTMVVFWKGDLGRQLITHENEGMRPVLDPPDTPPAPPEPAGPPDSPGLPPGLPPAPPPAGGRGRARAEKCIA